MLLVNLIVLHLTLPASGQLEALLKNGFNWPAQPSAEVAKRACNTVGNMIARFCVDIEQTSTFSPTSRDTAWTWPMTERTAFPWTTQPRTSFEWPTTTTTPSTTTSTFHWTTPPPKAPKTTFPWTTAPQLTWPPTHPTTRFTLAPLPIRKEVYSDSRLVLTGGNPLPFRSHAYIYYPSQSARSHTLPMAMSEPRFGHVTALLDGKIYVAGGQQNNESLRSCEFYDFGTGDWTVGPSMHRRRQFAASAVLRGFWYVCGGFDGFRDLSSCEYLGKARDRRGWRHAPSMSVARSQATAFDIDESMVILGGTAGGMRHSSIETLKPSTARWSFLSPMRSRRAGHACARVQNRLLVCGGVVDSGYTPTNSCEIYEIDFDRWYEVKGMNYRRSNFGMVNLDGKLWVLGGWYQVGRVVSGVVLEAVESYDLEEDAWAFESSLMQGKAEFGLVRIA